MFCVDIIISTMKNEHLNEIIEPVNANSHDILLLETLSKNVNRLMENEHISASELGRRINLPASTIKKIRNCDAPNPTVATLLPIARYFSLTLSQLVGDENMPYHAIHGTLQKIPVLSWEEVISHTQNPVRISKTMSLDPPESPSAYALVVEQNNLDNLSEGTVLIVNPEIKPKHLDLVIAHKAGQTSVCVKQWIDELGEVYLKPLISGCPFTAFTQEHTILGVVTEYRKRLTVHGD